MLELRNILKIYPSADNPVRALDGVSLKFRESEFVSILGQSGCGKTTLLNIVGGLDGYTDGDLIIDGVSTKNFGDRDWDAYRNHSIGFVFQSYNLIPHQTVLQNVELALTISGVSKAERRRRAKEALEKVGLGNQLSKRPNQLSGGQMQRVAIARAIVNDPEIILADEPTGALDTETSVQVMDILKEISENRLVIMVTHNPELAEQYSSRIIRMLDGKIINDSCPLTDDECVNEQKKEIVKAQAKKKGKRPSMSRATSFSLSLKNLFTKKGRTILTSFAGSIGIIGIALILAVSQGMTAYIDNVQESTLSVYPLTLEETTVDLSAMLEGFMNAGEGGDHELDAVYKDSVIGDMVDALSKMETSENDLAAFKLFLEEELAKEDSELAKAISGIQYSYALSPTVYTKNPDGTIIKSDSNELMMEMLTKFMFKISTGEANSEDVSSSMSAMSSNPMASMMFSNQMWQELLPSLDGKSPINPLLHEQYDLIHGTWPNEKDEIVLVVNENNELDDLTLYSLGLISREEIDRIVDSAASGKPLNADMQKWSYEEICGLSFKVVFPYDRYEKIGNVFVDISKITTEGGGLSKLYDEAMDLRVVGIIRPSDKVDAHMLTGAIGYTHMLTEHIIKEAADAEVVKAQLKTLEIDILTGLPFESSTGLLTNEEKQIAFKSYVAKLSMADKAKAFFEIRYLNKLAESLDQTIEQVYAGMAQMPKETLIDQFAVAFAEQLKVSPDEAKEYLAGLSDAEFEKLLRAGAEEQAKATIKGILEMELAMSHPEPKDRADALDEEINTYTSEQCALYYDEISEFSKSTYEDNLKLIGALDLDSPSKINLYASSFENKDIIVDAISRYNDSVDDAKKISYTDFLGIMMSSITTIINAISYVLIAFVSISLIVSSIMIGVITLISVQERTKEIGILRAIGASKRDVSSLFNAETLIIGFASGMLGVIVTYLLCIPINLILHAVTGIPTLSAQLPIVAAIILVAISMILTLFSGIIPSRSAAKKDPVVALRTE